MCKAVGCGVNKVLTTTFPKPSGLDPSNFWRWTLCNMCKAKVISEKNIGFKKKLGSLALQDFFCNNKFANIYISSSELNVVTYNTR
jgi:hypothetical protein